MCGKGRPHNLILNKSVALESICDSEQASVQDVDLNHDELPVQTMLGVKCSVNSDPFSFKVALDEKPATRWGVLSAITCVFDLQGFPSSC